MCLILFFSKIFLIVYRGSQRKLITFFVASQHIYHILRGDRFFSSLSYRMFLTFFSNDLQILLSVFSLFLKKSTKPKKRTLFPTF